MRRQRSPFEMPRRPIATARWLLLAAVVVLGACNGDDGRDDAGAPTKAFDEDVYDLRAPRCPGTTTTTTTAPPAGEQPLADFEGCGDAAPEIPGDCVLVEEGGVGETVGELRVVPCAERHSHEVYLIDDFYLRSRFGDDEYPGAVELEAATTARCFDAFERYVGEAPDRSDLSFTYLYPTLAGWSDPDQKDRELVCFVVGDAPEGGTFSSVRERSPGT